MVMLLLEAVALQLEAAAVVAEAAAADPAVTAVAEAKPDHLDPLELQVAQETLVPPVPLDSLASPQVLFASPTFHHPASRALPVPPVQPAHPDLQEITELQDSQETPALSLNPAHQDHLVSLDSPVNQDTQEDPASQEPQDRAPHRAQDLGNQALEERPDCKGQRSS
jgi:hypothetical protein